MQVLLKRAQAYSYLPRTAPKGETPAPINLLDVTKRKAAYVALLEDMRAEVAAKAKAAKAGKTLPPIVEAVRGITGMRAVELMAKGTDADSQKLADDLAAQAKALMGDASTAMAKRAKEIDADANSIIPNLNNNAANNGRTNTGRAGTNNNQTTTSYKKGLDTRSINELKEIIDNSTKVQSVAIDFEQVSKQNAAGFKEIADSADKTAKAASVTLKADYSGTQAK
jgi:hypothetical protein